jgi:regulator of protease activity HflC (stomatin/prohibitin superfamily)
MKKIIGSIVTGVVIILVIIGLFMCTEKIPAGYVGVVYNMNGGIEKETLSQGFRIVAPTKKIVLYSIGIEQSYLTAGENGDSKEDDSFEVPSKDGKGLTVDETFTYRFDSDRVSEIFTRFKGRSGKEVLTMFIKPNVISWTKEVTAKYYVTEILGEKRAALNVAITDYLRDKFEPYGIIIESASLIDINPDETTRQAIQNKVNAQQELELARIQKETATVEAQKEKDVAQINAEKAKIEAQGKAEAELIEAEADAKANKLISDSLTEKLIEKFKIEKWKGDVPSVQGNGATIVDVGDVEKTE